MAQIAGLEEKPDFIFCGGSGSLVFQSPRIFRELALPILVRTTELAYDMGLPTHVHSCGPEKRLVQMAAEETKLTVIDPLEVPPMGDCDLAELKQRFGDKIVLKGNLHTTRTMLRGTVDDVRRGQPEGHRRRGRGRAASSSPPATSAAATRPTPTSARWSRSRGRMGSTDRTLMNADSHD